MSARETMSNVLVPGEPTGVVTVAMGDDSAVTNSYACAVPTARETAAATNARQLR